MYGELIQKGKFTFTTRKFYILKHQFNDITLWVCLLCFPILGNTCLVPCTLSEQALPHPQRTSLNIEKGKIIVTVLYLLFNGFSVQRRHFRVVIAHADKRCLQGISGRQFSRLRSRTRFSRSADGHWNSYEGQSSAQQTRSAYHENLSIRKTRRRMIAMAPSPL